MNWKILVTLNIHAIDPLKVSYNLVSGLCAYHFLPKKPALKFEQEKHHYSLPLLSVV